MLTIPDDEPADVRFLRWDDAGYKDATRRCRALAATIWQRTGGGERSVLLEVLRLRMAAGRLYDRLQARKRRETNRPPPTARTPREPRQQERVFLPAEELEG